MIEEKGDIKIIGLSLRVLKYLSKKRNSTNIVYGSISFAMGIRSWEESAAASKILIEQGLAECNDKKIWISQKGIDYVEEITRKEYDEICLTVFDDYDFTLLKYFYNKNETISLDDIPDILKTHAPQYGNNLQDMCFMQHLEHGEMKKYISGNSKGYRINEDGKRYYEFKIKSLANKESVESKADKKVIEKEGIYF